jgi:hydroxymethylbilane synthase
MATKTIHIATRNSPLALWQANHVREQLLKQWPQIKIELLPMVTSGDRFLKEKLLAQGGKGLFVKELEEALLTRNADLAVHSTKDMPSELPEGLMLAAICSRDNPCDALISNHYQSLDQLPPAAVVGTASLRRQSQLLAYRPDLQVKSLRGNINTRLKQLETNAYDALILAAAGMQRMGLDGSIAQLISTDIMLPSCGQGALCLESRVDDEEILELIASLNDPLSSVCVHTERLVNAQLGGNCHVPLAVFCTVTAEHQLFLRAKVLTEDGKHCIENSQIGTLEEGDLIASRCTQALLSQGAAALLHTTSS